MYVSLCFYKYSFFLTLDAVKNGQLNYFKQFSPEISFHCVNRVQFENIADLRSQLFAQF